MILCTHFLVSGTVNVRYPSGTEVQFTSRLKCTMEVARANRRNPRDRLSLRQLLGDSLSLPSLLHHYRPMAPGSAIGLSSSHRSYPSYLRLVTLLKKQTRYVTGNGHRSVPEICNCRSYSVNDSALPNENRNAG